MSNIRVFGMPVHEKKIFKISPNFIPFCFLLFPNTGQPLDFCTFESPFPKDVSYQIRVQISSVVLKSERFKCIFLYKPM